MRAYIVNDNDRETIHSIINILNNHKIDYRVVPAIESLLDMVQRKELSNKDIVFIEIPEEATLNAILDCEQSAAELIKFCNVVVLGKKGLKLDNVISNTLFFAKYHFDNKLEYIPKDYGQRPDDRNTFERYLNLILSLWIK